MVQIETRERNFVSKVLSTVTVPGGTDWSSATPLMKTKGTTQDTDGSQKLISYKMTPKPPPEPLPFPLNVITLCFRGNMKYVMFPMLMATSLGLFLAFSRAVSSTHGLNNAYSQYQTSYTLSEDDPNFIPPEHVMFGHVLREPAAGAGPMSVRSVYGRTSCDCSHCNNEEVQELGTNPSQYSQLVQHVVKRFYGRPELTNQMSAFTPRKTKQWQLDSSYYLVAGRTCADDASPLVVVTVLTLHKHAAQRQAIRDTWGSLAKGKAWPNQRIYGTVRLVFLLGVSSRDDENNMASQEAETHGDLVLADFPEGYNELTRKVLTGFKWVAKFCPGAKYILKTDEDIFIDMPRLLAVLSSQEMTNTIYGSVSLSDQVVRDTSSKQQVTKEAYAPEFYPPHVRGTMYVLPVSLAKQIVDVAEYLPYVGLEDAHITGTLAKVLEARHLDIPERLYDRTAAKKPEPCDFVTGTRLLSQGVTPKLAHALWEKVANPGECGSPDGQKEGEKV
ncbi:uncharacterized protein LOC101847876 [Aplysia californica]|uniref:Hexosyltransferase n=1 Tax=Aplysia californica TaxID=6500 RepID=A0ABM1VTV3_APLCA|nr:uncharacterized protein LOC101847876 [Aplysia californica]